MLLPGPFSPEAWQFETPPSCLPWVAPAQPLPLLRISDNRALLAGQPVDRWTLDPLTEPAFQALCTEEKGLEKVLLEDWVPRAEGGGLRVDGWTVKG